MYAVAPKPHSPFVGADPQFPPPLSDVLALAGPTGWPWYRPRPAQRWTTAAAGTPRRGSLCVPCRMDSHAS